jgi:hypothetical protein
MKTQRSRENCLVLYKNEQPYRNMVGQKEVDIIVTDEKKNPASPHHLPCSWPLYAAFLPSELRVL